MGKSKGPDLPPAPELFEDPRFSGGIDRLTNLGQSLTNFDFSGSLSPLQATIDQDPQTTRLALQFAENALTPSFNRQIKQIRNEAAASGALQSSTFTDALSQASQDLNSQFQAIATQASLDDRSRALQNRMSLFGTGLDTTQAATGLAGQNQQFINNFNQQQWENQVTKTLSEQGQKSGGIFGGLTGGIGGAILGGVLAAPTGGMSIGMGALLGGSAGGLMGGLGPAGTGGQLLSAGGTIAGGMGGSGLQKLGTGNQPLGTLSERLRRPALGSSLSQVPGGLPANLFG